MSKKLIITEEEKDEIKSLHNINEQIGFEEIINYVKNLLNNMGKGTESKPNTNIVTSNITSDDDIYKGILECIGAKPTKNNMLFMYAWRQAEGGGSSNNPFNTTQKWANATILKNSSAGVKNYKTPEDGIQATCKTLKNGRYQSIIDGFKNDVGLSKLTDAVVNSPWGTKDLLRTVTQGYIAGNTPKPKPINRTEIV